MEIYGPPAVGSSADRAFQTTSAGSFAASNPAGSIFSFGGSPAADFYFGLSIVPGNLQPVANSQSVYVQENQTLSITLTAADPDGDPLTYAIVSSPANGTLSGTPPNIVYTPKTNFFGPDGFTFKANDGLTDSVPASVSIAVIPANGLKITPIFDSSITSDPNATKITNTINSAILVYESRFIDPVTVSIEFTATNSGLGLNSTFFNTISYSSFFSALSAHVATTNDGLALAHLTGGSNNPVNGGASIMVTLPNLRALGFTANPPGSSDSTIFVNLSICNLDRTSIDTNKFDLMAVVSHEIDEVLGTSSGLGQANIRPPDLFRYSATPGVRNYTTSGDNAYFSLDGTNLLARYNQNASGDYGDWWTAETHTPQVQDAFATAGSTPNLGTALTVLDVIGWNFFWAIALASAPQFTSITRTNSTIYLTWTSALGRNYQLLSSAGLASGTWTNLGSAITATGPTTSASDTIGTNQKRFYRVALLSPLLSVAAPTTQAQLALPPPTLSTSYLLPGR